LAPLIVSAKELPAIASVGFSPVIVGGGGLTVKADGDETPAVLVTVTETVPALATRVAGTEAVSCVALTKTVGRGFAPHIAVTSEVKFPP